MSHPIIVTESDAKKLRSLLQQKSAVDTTFAESVARLNGELERAKILPESELPANVIALNSTFELEDLVDREVQVLTLVMPEQADFSEGRISILAPVGMALLGYGVGDEIEWPVPGGIARMRVRKHLGRQPLSEGVVSVAS